MSDNHLTSDSAGLTQYPCPHCRKLTSWQGNQFRPFCSERCKLIDLGAWANEDYKINSTDGADGFGSTVADTDIDDGQW